MQKLLKPHVRNGYFIYGKVQFEVGSEDWFAWLSQRKGFIFREGPDHFSVQSEQRRGIPYWYAYRRRAGKLYKVYLGKSSELTGEALSRAGRMLSGETSAATQQKMNPPVDLTGGEIRIDSTYPLMSNLAAPPLPQKMVFRPRLTRLMNANLVLIQAPSGFGKSTLISEWRQGYGFPVAWLTLHREDNSFVHFWKLVMQALIRAEPELKRESISDVYPDLENPLRMVRRINEILTNGLSMNKMGLVLDDFQQINLAEILESLQIWIENPPPRMQFVLAGQQDFPLRKQNLRARGPIAELNAGDLRFSSSEGSQYLRQFLQDQDVSSKDLEKLYQHTEGWAAGLMLTGLALSKSEDTRKFMRTFSGAHLYLRDYFLETVLSKIKPDIQAFMVKTSVVKQMSGSLCNALTGRSDGEEILAFLAKENSFIIPSQEQGWYRYHDLFAEMLINQLHNNFSGEVGDLHRRAAQWYRTHSALADAVTHFLAAEDWDQSASLIEEMALRELEQYGEDSRLLRWLQELPVSIVQQHKTLLWVYLRLASPALPREKIEEYINKIETNLKKKNSMDLTPDEQEVMDEISRIRSFGPSGENALGTINSGSKNRESWHLLEGLKLLVTPPGLDSEQQDQAIFNLYQDALKQNNLFVIFMAGGNYAERALAHGHLRRSERLARDVLEKAMTLRGQLPETASIPLAIISRIYFEKNDIPRAQAYLQQAVEVDPNPTSTNMVIQIAVQQADLQLFSGRTDEALSSIKSAQKINDKRPSGGWKKQDLLALEALICLQIGDRKSAERILSLVEETGFTPYTNLVYAKIFYDTGQFLKAESLLELLVSEYEFGMRYDPILGIKILLSLALLEQNKVNRAVKRMLECLRAAEPEGFVRPFLNAGKGMVLLLQLVRSTGNQTRNLSSFVDQILAQLGHGGGNLEDGLQIELENLKLSAMIGTREQEIIKLVSDGMTNLMIAKQLSISESTVKTHLGHIFLKLKVNSRIRMVIRARELKLG